MTMVMVILTIIGILALVLYQQQSDHQLTARVEHHQKQAYYNLMTAFAELKYQMQKGRQGILWRPSERKVYLPFAGSGYEISLMQNGLYVNYHARGFYQKGQKIYSEVEKGSIFQELDDSIAVIIMDTTASLLLAGKAGIHGDIALYKGRIDRSYRKQMLFKGGSGHQGTVVQGQKFLANRFSPTLALVDQWIAQKNNEIAKASKRKKSLLDHCKNEEIISSLPVVIPSHAEISHCSVLAPEVQVLGKAHLENVLVYGYRLFLNGSGDWSGQFIARDSLSIQNSRTQNGPLNFMVRGNLLHPEDSKSFLKVKEFHGNANFWEMSLMDSDYPEMTGMFSDLAEVRGMIWISGYLHFTGKIEGMVVCWNFAYQDSLTRWTGFLKDGNIEQPEKGNFQLTPAWWASKGRLKFED